MLCVLVVVGGATIPCLVSRPLRDRSFHYRSHSLALSAPQLWRTSECILI